ncbi:MAG: hypothetical protein ACYDGM_01765 [Vulcanimicrobiaceae bacterium]
MTSHLPDEIRESADRLIAENPAIGEALKIFNVTNEQYETLVAAQGLVKTSAGTSTLLLSKHG